MNQFYTGSLKDRLSRQARFCRVFCITLILVSLVFCILLCCHVTTGNAARSKAAVILTAIFSGWIVMLLEWRIARPLKALAAHMEGILADEERTLRGELLPPGEIIRIPNSITLRRLVIHTPEGNQKMTVLNRNVSQLPPQRKTVLFHLVRSTVTGWEVDHE